MPSRSSAPVAGRIRSAQPPASSWNIVTTITRSACSASARTPGSAAASSPETTSTLIVSGFVSSASAAADQAAATARPLGVTGRWNAPQPGLSSNPSSCASSAIRAPPPPPGPDQTSTARSASRSRRPSSLPISESSRQNAAEPPGATCIVPVGEPTTISAPRRLASLIQRSTIGARSTTGSSPTTTTSSASAMRGQREPEGLERVGGRFGKDGRVRADPRSQEPPERIRDLGRLRAGERGHDPALGLAEHLLRGVERFVPGDLLQSFRTALERRRDAVSSSQMRVGEPPLVAEPAAIDLRVVAREDALDLALANRRRRVAAGGAARAHGGHVLDLPRPRVEAVRWST